MTTNWTKRLRDILEPLPTRDGGIALVLSTAGTPPAMALLSSGDVLVLGDIVRVGLWATTSAVTRLGGAFSLLVPAGDVALRVETTDATAAVKGDMALLEGQLVDIRPTAEPPWIAKMQFIPSDPSDPRVDSHLEYWSAVRAWLAGDDPPPGTPGSG